MTRPPAGQLQLDFLFYNLVRLEFVFLDLVSKRQLGLAWAAKVVEGYVTLAPL